MEEYISKTEAKKALRNALVFDALFDYAVEAIDKIPAAEVKEARRGNWRWIKDFDDMPPVGHRICSECGYYPRDQGLPNSTSFCPRCGANMRPKLAPGSALDEALKRLQKKEVEMSVTIRGMDMPGACMFCPLFNTWSGLCQVLEKPADFEGRRADCPVEVTRREWDETCDPEWREGHIDELKE